MNQMRIHIIPTYRCKLNCSYCYAEGFNEHFGGDLGLDEYKAIIDYFLPHGLSSISFLGGEPTMWPHLPEAVQHAQQLGLTCGVFSYGYTVTAVPDIVVLNITRFIPTGIISKRMLELISWYHERGVNIIFRLNIAKNDPDSILQELLPLAQQLKASLQFSALNTTPHSLDFGEKIYNWCKFFLSASMSVKLSRPLPECMLTEEQRHYLKSNDVISESRCDFENTVPVVNPDGKTVFPCNSLSIPLPLDYIHSKRLEYDEVKMFSSPCAAQFMPDECLDCDLYKNGTCCAGCVGTRTDCKIMPNTQYELLSVEQITKKQQDYVPEVIDWGTVTKLIAKSAEKTHYDASGYIKVGYSCNSRCMFCTVEWQKSSGDRDLDTILEEIDKIVSEHHVKIIHYSGGEPTIRKDLPQILSYAKKLGVTHQAIQTNARRLADTDYLKALLDGGATSFFVSIHAPDAHIHNSLVGSKTAFTQACAGLENLHRLGCRFSTNTVICRQNFLSLGRLIYFLFSQFPSLSKAKLSYPNIQGAAADNLASTVAPLWEVIPYVRYAINYGAQNGLYVDTESIPLCLLGKDCDKASELNESLYHISDIGFNATNWSILARAENNIFYDVCESCDLLSSCCGIYPLHHQTFGENPCFRPISFAI